MPSVDDAVGWAESTAHDDSHGYSMDDRQGPDYDCSSLVSNAFAEAGFGVSQNNWTGSMRDDFTAHGFAAIPAGDLDKPGDLVRGDVLLAEGEHTALYTGDGRIVEAGWDYDGAQGDSSGREVHDGDYYDHPWDWVLRWEGDDEDMPTAEEIAAAVWSYQYEGSDTPFNEIFFQLPARTARAVAEYVYGDDDVANGENIYNAVEWSWEGVKKLMVEVAALTEAVKTLASSQGADPDAVAKAVGDAVSAKLESLTIKVS